MRPETVRTTVALPASLLRAADRAVAEGAARSRNDLVAMAIQQLLAARARATIDEGFAGMGRDREYLAESSLLEAGLDRSSWEVFQQAESSQE